MSDKVLNRRDWLKVGIGAIAGAAMPSLWPLAAQAEADEASRDPGPAVQAPGDAVRDRRPGATRDSAATAEADGASRESAVPGPRKES